MQPERYEQTDASGLVKDTHTGAVINTDVVSFERYKALREKAKNDRLRDDEINALKAAVAAIQNQIDNDMKHVRESLNVIRNAIIGTTSGQTT